MNNINDTLSNIENVYWECSSDSELFFTPDIIRDSLVPLLKECTKYGYHAALGDMDKTEIEISDIQEYLNELFEWFSNYQSMEDGLYEIQNIISSWV